MAQELWDMVTRTLSPISARNAGHALNFNIRTQQEKHSRVWNMIFQNEDWITKATTEFGVNPILIGPNLHAYYNNDSQKYKPAYMVLETGDRSGDLRFHKELFLKSLKPHTFRKETGEVEFKSGITLNVISALDDPEMIYMETKRLFSYRHKRLRTSCLYWQDSQWALRTLGPKDIVGIGGSVSSIDDVAYICGLNFTLPDGQRVQHIYATPASERARIRPIKVHKKGCSGWEFY